MIYIIPSRCPDLVTVFLLLARANSRGHGTYVEDESVVSSVSGTIQRVNKLISVKPIKSRWVLGYRSPPFCVELKRGSPQIHA